MANILITGGNGYVGKSLASHLSNTHSVTSVSRIDFDLSNSHQTNKWFSNKHFDVVIHTAISGGSRLREDGPEVLDNNLQMYYNLIGNRDNFGRFINVGSGAELHQQDKPYGLSKHVIRQSLLGRNDFYNIRVYAVFDENELPTRFIKHSIRNYINRQPIVIIQDKYMDFFYMKDFIRLVNHYISSDAPHKEVDCSYSSTPSLKSIAEKINTLGNYDVDIQYVTPGLAHHYAPPHVRTGLPVELCGWERGIELTYEALCNL